jgi:hypothetical protein
MAELLNNFFSSVFTREDTEHILWLRTWRPISLRINITDMMAKENIGKLKAESLQDLMKLG